MELLPNVKVGLEGLGARVGMDGVLASGPLLATWMTWTLETLSTAVWLREACSNRVT